MNKILIKPALKYLFFMLILLSIILVLPAFFPDTNLYKIVLLITAFLFVTVLFPCPINIRAVELNSGLFFMLAEIFPAKLNPAVSELEKRIIPVLQNYDSVINRSPAKFSAFCKVVLFHRLKRNTWVLLTAMFFKRYDWNLFACSTNRESKQFIYHAFSFNIREILVGSLTKLIESGELKQMQTSVDEFGRHQEEVIRAELGKIGMSDFHS